MNAKAISAIELADLPLVLALARARSLAAAAEILDHGDQGNVKFALITVSYTHLTLPTNREV